MRIPLKEFQVKKSDILLLYGGAYAGKELLYCMQALGYKVSAFLDKRAQIIQEIEGIKVYEPEEYKGNPKEALVIITTGNPISVANYLYSLHFEKIIYRTDLFNGKLSDPNFQIGKTYEGLLNGQTFPSHLPLYVPEIMDKRFTDGAFLFEEQEKVSAFVPTDLLFDEEQGEWKHIYVKYRDVFNYFKAFDGNISNVVEAIQLCAKDTEIEKLLGSSYMLSEEERYLYTQDQLNRFHRKLYNGMEWFIQNPISLTLIRGKFLIEKKDLFQIFFLLSKGFVRIPALLPKAHYHDWINEKILHKAVAYAKTHDLPTSYTLLEHPNFYHFPAARDVFGNTRIIRICEYLGKNNLKISGSKIIDIGSYYGFFSRFFARMDAIVSSVEFHREAYEMGVLFNELLHLESIEALCMDGQYLQRKKEFDLALMLTVLYWHMDTPLGIKLIKAVDHMTKKFLLWESGDEPEREKHFIFSHSSFHTYEKICETVGTGKLRELGIFTKQ